MWRVEINSLFLFIDVCRTLVRHTLKPSRVQLFWENVGRHIWILYHFTHEKPWVKSVYAMNGTPPYSNLATWAIWCGNFIVCSTIYSYWKGDRKTAHYWPFYGIHQSRVNFSCDMMTSSNGNIFRVTGHLCREFTGPRCIPRTKSSDAELFFSLICVWINGWVNNREAGDLRRYRAHYDVTVMELPVMRKRFHILTSTYDEWKTPAVSASRPEYFEYSAINVRIVNLKGGPAIPISEGPISPGVFLVKPVTSKHR